MTIAILYSNLETIRWLLDQIPLKRSESDEDGDGLLHTAGARGQPEIIEELLRRKININLLNTNKMTSLQKLVVKHSSKPSEITTKCMQLLLDAGVNVNNLDSESRTAITGEFWVVFFQNHFVQIKTVELDLIKEMNLKKTKVRFDKIEEEVKFDRMISFSILFSSLLQWNFFIDFLKENN